MYMGLLSRIKEICEELQYCHTCPVRSFCTELRAKPPKYWPDKVLKTYDALGQDPAEEPAPAKKTRKKKGE